MKGMPNITYKSRKPVNLGACARNAVDALTGIMCFQDPITDLTSQRLKEFMQTNNILHMPGGGILPVHVAETLRQAIGGNTMRHGWRWSDVWFGSVTCCVELMVWLGIYSSKCLCLDSSTLYLTYIFVSAFIVKQNTQFFPKEILEAILRA